MRNENANNQLNIMKKGLSFGALIIALLVLTNFVNAQGVGAGFDEMVGVLNGKIAGVLFFDVTFGLIKDGLPFAVAWLVIGAIFFTLRFGFINIRGFAHAIQITRGKYDDANDIGDVSHFQALTAALSATVGLGNIAGVAIAVATGGPGATFWMVLAGFLGMSLKFAECTLAQIYREVRSDGHVMGGAMEYLSRGLKEKGMGGLGKVLAVLFCILCIGGSFGGGNAFQVKQSLGAFSETFPYFADHAYVYGIIMAIAVGVVIIGGIKSIANVAERIVPFMCVLYVAACLWIILSNISALPSAIGTIFTSAFDTKAMYGGALGVLIIGFKRAAFSNEAGVGSAAIAHSAAKTKYPIREGLVATLEPFIDTIVICTMTALVIVITGAYNSADPEFTSVIASNNGAALTSKAFGQAISWFPMVLAVSVVLFAYSTMISWSYYGERCWAYLFGEKTSIIYKVLFIGAVFAGSIMSATNVLDFSDLMILAMAVPNLLGVYLLSGKIRSQLTSYMTDLKAGKFN